MCTLSGSVETHHIAVMIVTARQSQTFSPAAQWPAHRTLTARPAQLSAGNFAPPRACEPRDSAQNGKPETLGTGVIIMLEKHLSGKNIF